MRSVVFKTKGKLDLRSIMTFGLNSKPNTGHPIGFFGTGLKYALAVLTRNKIPVTIYIDSRKWSITTEDSVFRDKTVTEIFLERHRTLMPPSVRKLPFTTELGKTWELWQAFRELHSNTLDEQGETFVELLEDLNKLDYPKGYTYICVQSEEFVQEYFGRDKTFLPDGLVQREGTENVQIFDQPSKHIYYRGIRVLDLDDKEVAQLTYNILSRIDLTEDRTAKSKWDVQYTIQAAVSKLEDKARIEKVITAPKASFESSMNFYDAPSKTFLEVTSEAVHKRSREVTYHATEMVKRFAPKSVKRDWYTEVIEAIRNKDWEVVEMYSNTLIAVIQQAQEATRGELPVPEVRVHSVGDGEGDASVVPPTPEDTRSETNTHAQTEDDDIPF